MRNYCKNFAQLKRLLFHNAEYDGQLAELLEKDPTKDFKRPHLPMAQLPIIAFIADLHLSPQRPDILERFQSFTDDISSNVSQLYILGDLFDFWIGDDATSISGFDGVARLLRQVNERGVEIFLQRGNRDFMLGENFAQKCGAILLDDPVCIELGDHRVLLSHGDRWCTDDKAYMQLRQMVNDPKWQEEALSKPVPERLALANELRLRSEVATKDKEHSIMDVNDGALTKECQELACDIIIHGHTHRPAVHRENGFTRYVLGDWFNQDSWIIWQDDEFKVNTRP